MLGLVSTNGMFSSGVVRDIEHVNPPLAGLSGIHVIVQSLSCIQLFVTPWAVAFQASLSFTISWSLLKLITAPTEAVIPFNHFILCHPLLPLPSIFPSIRVFSSESALCIRDSCKRDTDVQNRLLDSVGEGEGGMFRENSIETCILSIVKQITSPGWMH